MSMIAVNPSSSAHSTPVPTTLTLPPSGRPVTVGAFARARPDTHPAATVRADLFIKYRAGPDERRLVELRPWGDKQQLMAHSRGPREHDCDTRLLPMAHDGKRSPVVQTLRALAALYFGATGLTPRILGEPDWREATMALQADADGDFSDLLKVHLRVEGHTGLRAQVRHSLPDQPQTGPATLVMRPGDADPLHALLRVGFGTTPWQVAG